jgi:hypothetical protein
MLRQMDRAEQQAKAAKKTGRAADARGTKSPTSRPAAGSGSKKPKSEESAGPTNGASKGEEGRNGHRPGGPKKVSKKQKRDETGDKRR